MKQKDEEKYHLLLNATLDQVYETGLSGLKIAHIVKRAGLGTGTFYVYFKSKKELLRHLYQRTKETSLRFLFSLDQKEQPFRVRLEQLIEQTVIYRMRYRREVFFSEQYVRSEDYQELPKQQIEQNLQPFAELLAQGQRERLLKPLDEHFLLAVLSGIIRNTTEAKATMQNNPDIDPQWLQQVVDACWDSIKR